MPKRAAVTSRLVGLPGPNWGIFLEQAPRSAHFFCWLRELKRPALGLGATYITGIGLDITGMGLDTAEMQGFLKRPDWDMPACSAIAITGFANSTRRDEALELAELAANQLLPGGGRRAEARRPSYNSFLNVIAAWFRRSLIPPGGVRVDPEDLQGHFPRRGPPGDEQDNPRLLRLPVGAGRGL